MPIKQKEVTIINKSNIKKSINVPFTYGSGIVITKEQPYLTQGENRSQRRHKEPPFIGNGKQYPLTVSGTVKYLRSVQIVPFKMVKGKLIGGNKILHYLPL